MFYRANPGMTSLPCSCKDIYSRNATDELLQEDKNYDRYGRLGYTNILYNVKETNLAKAKSHKNDGFSKVFNQLELHPESKPTVFEFLEMSPWSACTTLRESHKTCGLLSEKLDIPESSKSENQIQRHPVSTLEASVNSMKKGKCENNPGSVRPYSDSKLNDNSRKPSTFGFKKTFTFEENYRFYHFKDFARYIGEYTDTVTLPRLQEHYRIQNRRRGNARAMTTRQQWVSHNALRSRKVKDVREVRATNPELVSRDSSINNTSCEQARNETYYNVHFPSFETCSFKMAQYCVHAENRRERIPRTYRDDKVKEEGSGVDKIQMFCERLSTTNCGKDERRRSHWKSSKILQKSKMRKLEIVTRPPNSTTPRKKPSLTTITQPSRWQESTKFGRQFPSPRIVSRTSLVTKPAQFQEKIVAKKSTTIMTVDESPDTQKVFPDYESDVVDGND